MLREAAWTADWFSPSPLPSLPPLYFLCLNIPTGTLGINQGIFSMQIKSNVFAAMMLCAVSPIVHAASDETLGEVVVTATRIKQPLTQSLSSTTVITRQDIRDSQAPDLPSILRNVAGVEIDQGGGIGKTAGLFLRGTESKHALVLVDGVRINSATSGSTALDQLMLDQIERIEVVRGNVSSVYGSEAIGGVVQIFTRRGRGAPAGNISAGVGSQGTRRVSTGFGGAANGADFSVQLSSFKTDGVSSLNPSLLVGVNPDKDGYRNNSLSTNLGYSFSANHRVLVSLFGSNGNSEYDSAYNANLTDTNSNRSRIWKLSLTADDQINEIWHSKLQLAKGVDQYRDFRNGVPVSGGSLYQTGSDQLSWQNALSLDDSQQFLLGAEILRQEVSSTLNPGYVQTTRQINSLFAGYTGNYGLHQLQLNLRHDHNSQYGGKTTGLLGYGYSLTDTWRASASYSTAFRAPTFNELYWPDGGYGGGNPALQPERSRNLEAGLHYASEAQQFDVVYFDNRIRDLISGWPPVNVNKARINGFEFSYAGRFGDTGIKAALTSQNPRDDTTGAQLIRRAKLHSSLGLVQHFGTWQVGGEWQYSGTRRDTNFFVYPTTSTTLAAYNVFNLTAGYAINKETRLSLRADNLTNQDDSSAYGYSPLGRRVFIGINYQPH
jgi:vitamin B12 transporter